MTMYRLPEWLGGHEVEALGELPPDRTEVKVFSPSEGPNAIVAALAVPTILLTEVEPPMPEPENRAVIREGGTHGWLWERTDSPTHGDYHWFSSGRFSSGLDRGYTWEEICKRATGIPPIRLIRLIPDPVATAPELPWEVGHLAASVTEINGRVEIWAGDAAMDRPEDFTPDDAELFAAVILRAAREARSAS